MTDNCKFYNMELNELYCLVEDAGKLSLTLQKVENLDELHTRHLEINLEKGQWRYINQYPRTSNFYWHQIGKPCPEIQYVQIVFDPKDFEQLKRAFSFASSYYANRIKSSFIDE